MYEDADLTNPLDVEQVRRSIAMLPPGARALNREEAMRVLDALATAKRASEPPTP